MKHPGGTRRNTIMRNKAVVYGLLSLIGRVRERHINKSIFDSDMWRMAKEIKHGSKFFIRISPKFGIWHLFYEIKEFNQSCCTILGHKENLYKINIAIRVKYLSI